MTKISAVEQGIKTKISTGDDRTDFKDPGFLRTENAIHESCPMGCDQMGDLTEKGDLFEDAASFRNQNPESMLFENGDQFLLIHQVSSAHMPAGEEEPLPFF